MGGGGWSITTRHVVGLILMAWLMWEAAFDMQQMVLKELVKALTDILQVEKSIHIANALRNSSNINKLFLMILFSFGLCLLLLYHMVPKATEAPTQFKINCNALPAALQADQAWEKRMVVWFTNWWSGLKVVFWVVLGPKTELHGVKRLHSHTRYSLHRTETLPLTFWPWRPLECILTLTQPIIANRQYFTGLKSQSHFWS